MKLTNPNLQIGPVIKKYRMEKQLSQEELGHRCYKDRACISMLERGLKMPSFTTVILLAFAFDMKPSELLKEMEDYGNNLLAFSELEPEPK